MERCNTPLTLVILAAGMGSRFGGDKPLAAVGPDGQSLFEYSVHDAFMAGFNHVIFVVNDQQDTTEISLRLREYGSELKIEFVIQSLTACMGHALQQTTAENASSDRISGAVRKKPWGTAHAVLVCQDYIHNPFVVINADDYHGQKNYVKIGHYLLAQCQNPGTCVLPGYRLINTLSNSGGVNRGICKVGSDGYLKSIREVSNILIEQPNTTNNDHPDGTTTISNNSIVSMTFWGFMPSIFNLLHNEFQFFLKKAADVSQDEFYIPDVVNSGIKLGLLKVMVFETAEKWKGLTYVDDLPEVRAYISMLSQSGAYAGITRR